MPRAKKKQAQGSDGARMSKKKQDTYKARFWSARIAAGLKAKNDYVETANDVVSYLKSKHQEMFKQAAEAGFNFEGKTVVSIPTVAQMKNSLAPHLYMPNPKFNVNTQTDDPVMICLCRVLQAYLNYTSRESKLGKQLRKAIDDSLLRGRGVMRVVWDEVREIVTSTYVSSLDLVIDPDYTSIDDAQWVAIRRREPLWVTKRRIEAKWRTKGLEGYCGTEPADGEAENDRDDQDAGDKQEQSGENVTYWEVLSRMGCGYRGSGMEDVEDYEDSNDFVRLEVIQGWDHLLSEDDWDVPLYMDRDWPFSALDLIEVPDQLWPESLHGQILSTGKAVDLLSSLRLNSCRNRDRFLMLGDKRLQADIQERLRNGGPEEYLGIDIPNGMTLDAVVKVLELGGGSVESFNERNFLLQQMEVTTGVTGLLTGAQDSGPADRSATATQARSSGSESRLGDFKSKVEEWAEDLGNKEAIVTRLFVNEEQIRRYVKISDINYTKISVMIDDVELHVRNPFPPETKKVPITLQDLDPSAATYFETSNDAIMAAMQMWQKVLTSTDPKVTMVREALSKDPINEMTGCPQSIGVSPVTPEDVWWDSSGLTVEELMREFNYSIAVGSGMKFNKDQERDNATEMLQTVLPVALGNGDIATANKLLAMRDDAYDVPDDKRIVLQPPPPPPPQQGGEPDQDESQGPPK